MYPVERISVEVLKLLYKSFKMKSEIKLRELFIFFFIDNSSSFSWNISSLSFFGSQLNICCFVISLSFQKIGGLELDIVNSILLFFLYSSESISIFFWLT